MRPLRVLETALYASDLDAAETFYTGVLGLEVIGRMEGRHVFFRCGDGVLLVFDPAATSAWRGSAPAHGATGPGHMAFAASGDDLEAWRTRLANAGVEIEAAVVWPNGSRSLYVRDPAGNSVEFAEPRLWGFGDG